MNIHVGGKLMGDKDYFSKICLCRAIWQGLSVSSGNGSFSSSWSGRREVEDLCNGKLCSTFRHVGGGQRAFLCFLLNCQSGIFWCPTCVRHLSGFLLISEYIALILLITFREWSLGDGQEKLARLLSHP